MASPTQKYLNRSGRQARPNPMQSKPPSVMDQLGNTDLFSTVYNKPRVSVPVASAPANTFDYRSHSSLGVSSALGLNDFNKENAPSNQEDRPGHGFQFTKNFDRPPSQGAPDRFSDRFSERFSDKYSEPGRSNWQSDHPSSISGRNTPGMGRRPPSRKQEAPKNISDHTQLVNAIKEWIMTNYPSNPLDAAKDLYKEGKKWEWRSTNVVNGKESTLELNSISYIDMRNIFLDVMGIVAHPDVIGEMVREMGLERVDGRIRYEIVFNDLASRASVKGYNRRFHATAPHLDPRQRPSYSVTDVEELIREKVAQKCGGSSEQAAAFRFFDVDKNGKITSQEFRQVLRNLNLYLKDAEIKALMDKYDRDGNGTMELHEFVGKLLTPDWLLERRTQNKRQPALTYEMNTHIERQLEDRREPYDVHHMCRLIKEKITTSAGADKDSWSKLRSICFAQTNDSPNMSYSDMTTILSKLKLSFRDSELRELFQSIVDMDMTKRSVVPIEDFLMKVHNIQRKSDKNIVTSNSKGRVVVREIEAGHRPMMTTKMIETLIREKVRQHTDGGNELFRAAQYFKRDPSGTISREDFARVLANSNLLLKPEEMDQLVEEYDGGNGRINIQAFIQEVMNPKWLVQRRLEPKREPVLPYQRDIQEVDTLRTQMDRQPQSVETLENLIREKIRERTAGGSYEARQAFRHFDRDGNGYIDYEEFKRALQIFNMNLTEFELHQLITRYDKSGDGLIDMYEFIAVLYKNPNQQEVELPQKLREEFSRTTSPTKTTKYARFGRPASPITRHTMNIDEILTILREKVYGKSYGAFEQTLAFKTFDIASTGWLDRRQLKIILEQLNMKLKDEEIDMIVEKFSNNKGRIPVKNIVSHLLKVNAPNQPNIDRHKWVRYGNIGSGFPVRMMLVPTNNDVGEG